MISFFLLQDTFVLLKIKTAEETHNYSLSIQTVLSMHICISLMWWSRKVSIGIVGIIMSLKW